MTARGGLAQRKRGEIAVIPRAEGRFFRVFLTGRPGRDRTGAARRGAGRKPAGGGSKGDGNSGGDGGSKD